MVTTDSTKRDSRPLLNYYRMEVKTLRERLKQREEYIHKLQLIMLQMAYKCQNSGSQTI